MMGKHPNHVHVYNFGYFYMPSYQDGYEETYDVDMENGKLSVWEGDLNSSYEDPDASNHKWPII